MSLRQRLGFKQEPLYLMDGTAFVFRGFYAYQNMARSDGFPTNALFIVTRILLKMLREEKPLHFAFIMDGKGPNFRHGLFADYKAQRTATPEPLVRQLEPTRRTLTALGLPLIVSDGCEADDCIASLAARFRDERPVVIIGADKDLKQCLHPNVVLWDPASKEEKITTLASFKEEMGMEPESWPDFQAITGDSSDNIPGVPGIGFKTAMELFKDFSSLEDIQSRFAAVPPKIRKKLDGQMDNALLYRQLTALRTDTCTPLSLADLSVQPLNLAGALAVLEEFELRTLIRELESMDRAGALRTDVQGDAATIHAGNIGENTGAQAAPRPQKKSAAPAQASLPLVGPAAQTLTDSAPALPPAAGFAQGSLLDLSGAPAALSLPALERVEDLPPLDGPLALVVSPADANALVLASGSREWLYSSPTAPLATHLAAYLAQSTAPSCVLVTPDLKALYTSDAAWKALPAARCFDLSLAAYLLNPEDREYSWPRLAARWGEQVADRADAATHPGLLALQLHTLFSERLHAAQAHSLLHNLEMPLIPVLKDMEEAGIRIDRKAFAAFHAEVQTELERLGKSIHELAGGPFNIRSSQQLGDVLFGTLQLPKAGKTKGGAASTSQEVLEKLSGKHPIVDAILEYRKLEKLRSTYLEPLPLLADANDRIHTTFNLMATATGRLSSSNPNLQNIPVRGPMGHRMRACFIAAEGLQLVSADYSQIELRVLAHLSQDPMLLDAFRKGEDIHSRTAALLYDTSPESVTPEQRRGAKTINFGLVYGMGPQKLAQDLGITLNEAKAFIARYFERLGSLRVFYDAVEQETRDHGYITTLTGRRRYIPEISSSDAQLKSQARRQAINARVQGSAADIIKIAMLAVAHDETLQKLGARLLLQVHDELVLEAPAQNATAAGERLAALMMDIAPGGTPLSVPLAVDWGKGDDWDTAH